MFMPGMVVKQKGRWRLMVVMTVEEEWITCGWSAAGRFHQQCFPPQVLRICSPAADVWPVS